MQTDTNFVYNKVINIYKLYIDLSSDQAFMILNCATCDIFTCYIVKLPCVEICIFRHCGAYSTLILRYFPDDYHLWNNHSIFLKSQYFFNTTPACNFHVHITQAFTRRNQTNYFLIIKLIFSSALLINFTANAML